MTEIRFSSPGVQRLAEQALAGTLNHRGQRRLARVLSDPDAHADREAYDQLARLFGVLEGADGLLAAQRERILDDVMRSLDVAPDRPRASLRHTLRWLAPALGVLLVALGIALLVRPRGPDLEEGFQPRGSQVSSGRDTLVGLKAHCVRGGGIVAPVEGQPRCELSDELQLSVTHTAGYTHLLVIGVHEDGGELWYYPVPPTGRSGLAPRQVEDEPLGEAIRLDVNHRPGAVRLVAVFSRAPVEASQLLSQLQTRTADGAEGRADMTVVKLRVTIKGGAP